MITTVLNAVLAPGVIVMVVTPLVWAILAQRRDLSRAVAEAPAHRRASDLGQRRPERVRRFEPAAGRS